jgi:hypothetical protein
VGVRDSAGNPTGLSNTSLQVRLATADVPTVQGLNTNTLTPTLEGTAQKVSGTTFVALGSNDLLAVSVNGTTYISVNGITQKINGTSSLADLVAGYAQSATYSPTTTTNSATLSYNSTNARWSLSLPVRNSRAFSGAERARL